jgi:hypothetical protein
MGSTPRTSGEPAPRFVPARGLNRVHGLVAGFGRAAPCVTREALIASLNGLTAEHLHLSTDALGTAVAIIDPGSLTALPP